MGDLVWGRWALAQKQSTTCFDVFECQKTKEHFLIFVLGDTPQNNVLVRATLFFDCCFWAAGTQYILLCIKTKLAGQG